MSAPKTCANCGADVPRGALACPECGADENTGWNERANSQRTAEQLGIPNTDFNYDDFVREEFGGQRESATKTKGVSWLWWVVALSLAAAFAAACLK
ncbi:MAG: zinc ribbon domain-containing protein [Verrucomicrobia bacterium]|nr:zinc ribbon domain-containing protein [Verrucomicrobiota bacterium]MBM3870599.1 zinc ribbon domain-containing protein [Verrucomicrobiota bacterium]